MSLRLDMTAICLLLIASVVHASLCERLRSQPDAWVSAKVNALVLAAHAAYEDEENSEAYEKTLGEIEATIQRCELSKDKAIASRFPEFIGYVEALSLDKKPDHELGFVVPDKQYFEETRSYVQIPDFLATQRFIRAASRHESLNHAKAILRALNSTRDISDQLIFFSYKSRHLGTPDNDNSFERLLIFVPGNAEAGVPEKWVQFGITDAGRRTRIRNVSVVSTIAAEDGTSNVYFKDYYRTYRRDGSINVKGRWELGYGDDNCASCHKSGVLPIFPVAGSVSQDELHSVELVNQRFRSYGTPRFEKYLDTSAFGPGLGSAGMEDRLKRFGEGFGETSLARSMTCAACHTSGDLGPLNWPMDKTLISSYVKGGPMPFNVSLRPSERAELYNKLVQEYFATDPMHPGILKTWLLGKIR